MWRIKGLHLQKDDALKQSSIKECHVKLPCVPSIIILHCANDYQEKLINTHLAKNIFACNEPEGLIY